MFGLPRRVVASSFSIVVSLWMSGCTCGSGPYEGDYFDGDRPGPADYKYAESTKGDPKVVGCADGQREGFADLAKHPRIAGCVGNWKSTKSLRDTPTGKACGDDGEACAAPADVCATGWHVCAQDGNSGDLAAHTTVKDCDNAGPGRFNAAISHSPTDEINPCPPIKKDQVMPCVMSGLGSEPVCCGNDCAGGKCKDAVWKGKTKISRGTSEGCGAITADRNAGILCCFSGEGNPTAGGDAKAPDAKADDAKAPTDAKAPDAKADDAKAPADAKLDEKKVDDAGNTPADKKADAKKAEEAKAEEKKAEEKKAG
jgi:hypothetical protein